MTYKLKYDYSTALSDSVCLKKKFNELSHWIELGLIQVTSTDDKVVIDKIGDQLTCIQHGFGWARRTVLSSHPDFTTAKKLAKTKPLQSQNKIINDRHFQLDIDGDTGVYHVSSICKMMQRNNLSFIMLYETGYWTEISNAFYELVIDMWTRY